MRFRCPEAVAALGILVLACLASNSGIACAQDNVEPRLDPQQGPNANASCSRVRRSVSELSDSEWIQFVTAIGRLRRSGVWDQFSLIHADHEFEWHRGAYFLPAHRQLLWELENEIRTFCPTCTIPYWDWSTVSTRWTFDQVWDRLGGSNGGEVPNPPFNHWNVIHANPHIVRRTFIQNSLTNVFGIRSRDFESRANFDALIRGDIVRAVGFANFSRYLEIVHGGPHNEIGGDMSNMWFSPNLPEFWLHHANVDRIWAQWQAAGNGNDFGGNHRILPRTFWNQQTARVSLEQVLGPPSWGRTVREILSGEPSSCVTYSGVASFSSRMVNVESENTSRAAPHTNTFASPDVEKEVSTSAAKKKARDATVYKEACIQAVRSKEAFYAGGYHSGISQDHIDESYNNVKKKLDAAVLGVLVEDLENPSNVLSKSDDEVMQEGKNMYEKLCKRPDLN